MDKYNLMKLVIKYGSVCALKEILNVFPEHPDHKDEYKTACEEAESLYNKLKEVILNLKERIE